MMPEDFTSTWAKETKVPGQTKIVDIMNPVPIRERITQTVFRLNNIQRKLEDSHLRMEQKHKTLFNKCVRAQENKDSQTAVIYANECAQVKKIAHSIVSSQLALEQVVLRLDTVKDFGDTAVELLPALSVIRAVKGRLSGVIPEVSMELGVISQSLDSLVLEVGEATSQRWNIMPGGEEADKVLAEASMIAEQKVKEGFPELPSTTTPERGINTL